VASKAGDRILRSIIFTDGSAAVVVLVAMMSPVVPVAMMSSVSFASGVAIGVVSGAVLTSGVAFRGNASCPTCAPPPSRPPWSSTIDVDILVVDVEQPWYVNQ